MWKACVCSHVNVIAFANTNLFFYFLIENLKMPVSNGKSAFKISKSKSFSSEKTENQFFVSFCLSWGKHSTMHAIFSSFYLEWIKKRLHFPNKNDSIYEKMRDPISGTCWQTAKRKIVIFIIEMVFFHFSLLDKIELKLLVFQSITGFFRSNIESFFD